MSDGFYVKHNVSAMFAHRQSTINNGSLNKSLEKLSSGYRINRASDDIAGLAVSEKMRTQIKGAHQANKNAQNAISIIHVADAAMQEATEIVQRMRELAVQAATGTYTEDDRLLIQQEIDELKKALDSNAEGAEFNRLKLNAMEVGHEQANLDLKTNAGFSYTDDGIGGVNDLNGDGSSDYTNADMQRLRDKLEYWIDYAARQTWGRTGLANNGAGGTSPENSMTIRFAENTTAMVALTGLAVSATANDTTLTLNLTAFIEPGGKLSENLAGQTPEQIIAHEITHTLTLRGGNVPSLEAWPIEGIADWASVGLDTLGVLQNGIANPAGAGAFPGGSAESGEAAWAMRYITEKYGAVTLRDFYRRWGNAVNEQSALVQAVNAVDPTVTSFAQFDSNFQAWRASIAPQGWVSGAPLAETNINTFGNTASKFKPVPNQVLKMHIGSNKNQTIEVKTYLTTAGGLDFISFVNVRDQAEARRSLRTLDNALNILARGRSALGAIANRIEHSMNFIGVYGENMQLAESRIRDSDMANEVIDFTKTQVLVQSANAMLAQANLQPQNVLALLG